jgi:D-glycero-alpha-D-manno-heptose-7-phosphate kinase
MLISSTPLRISLGGGGTDLPFYYQKYGGFVLGAAIKKYVYITISNHFEKIIKLNYSQTEICDSPKHVKHPIIREALNLMGIKDHIEIGSIADLPAKSGLGSSGSFTVGLLNGLYTHLGKNPTRKELAEIACKIEMDLLKEPVGKQDQYIASYGGFSCININRLGKVKVVPLQISSESIQDLEHNLTFFYTGVMRSASQVLNDQKKTAVKNDQVFESLTRIKRIGLQIKKCLEKDNLDEFGRLMDEHWIEKKKTSGKISNDVFDEYYNLAKTAGALGGKIIGAGGGGFFLFYTDTREKRKRLRKEFIKRGLSEVRMPFEMEGTKIILNLEGRRNEHN